MAQIIDGYTDKPNIFAENIGEYNISLYGSGDYVLSVGQSLGYELVSNNEIRIKDGMFVTQGRRGYIKKGTADTCIIENGAQAVKRNDLIVIEYAKDEATLVESHTIKVIKGIPGEVAADPEIVTGDIPGGSALHQMLLYRVKIDGLNVTAVEQLFKMGSVAKETVDPMFATEEGFAADALATKKAFDEQNKKIPFSFGIDEEGNYGYKKAGADTVIPFLDNNDDNFYVIGVGGFDSNTSNSKTHDVSKFKKIKLLNFTVSRHWGGAYVKVTSENTELYKFTAPGTNTSYDNKLSEEIDISNYSSITITIKGGSSGSWNANAGYVFH